MDIQVLWQIKSLSLGPYQVSKNHRLENEATAKWYWPRKISRYKFYHPKSVKLLSDIIAKPLTTARSNCLGGFPKNPKLASITRVHKGEPNKLEISNYTPVIP